MTDASPNDTTPTTPTKPGYKTTEFWLSLLATLLTALYASGVLTTSASLAIAGIAATVLTALGYKVSRTLVKTAAILALLVFATSSQLGCSWLKADAKDAAHSFVDCTKPAATTAIAELGPAFLDVVKNATSDSGKVDWAPVNHVAAPLKSIASQCAFAAVIAEVLHPKVKPGAPQSSPLVADPNDVIAGFGAIRTKWGGLTYKLPEGEL